MRMHEYCGVDLLGTFDAKIDEKKTPNLADLAARSNLSCCCINRRRV